MGTVLVNEFVRANPNFQFIDDGDGEVTPNDAARLDGVRLDWNDSRYQAARRKVEHGIKSTDHVTDLGMIGGAAVDLLLSKILLPISIGYALFGGNNNDDGVVGRFVNTWTYFPRMFSE